MTLSIIIPTYNEEKTIATLIDRVKRVQIPMVKRKEIIIIDDGSTDGTFSELTRLKDRNIKIIHHKKNLGKGAAIKSGIKEAIGMYIVIQDADLEYNPQDIAKLLEPIVAGKTEVVYGTRLKRFPDFKRDERTFRLFIHYVGNKALSFFTSLLYGQWVTDMETGYKILPKKVIKELSLSANRFDFEPEITAKLLKKGYKIFEVPIRTIPRGYNEGKKLNTVKDGIAAFMTLLRCRFTEL